GGEATDGGEAHERLRNKVGGDGPGIELQVQRLGEVEVAAGADIFAVADHGEGKFGQIRGQFPIQAHGARERLEVKVFGLEPEIGGQRRSGSVNVFDPGEEVAQRVAVLLAEGHHSPVSGAGKSNVERGA